MLRRSELERGGGRHDRHGPPEDVQTAAAIAGEGLELGQRAARLEAFRAVVFGADEYGEVDHVLMVPVASDGTVVRRMLGANRSRTRRSEMGQCIEGRSRDLLEAPNFCHVATVRKDGTPYVVPTWVDVDGDRVVLNTADGRLWPKNLRRDPRVTLTVSPTDNPYEYLTIRGRVAEETKDGAEEHIDKMAQKYLGQDTYPYRQPGEERVMFRIEPEDVRHQAQ